MIRTEKKTALVISVHSADFVWRAGGAVALYAARGGRVVVVCLSFGERGESAQLWRQPGMTMEKVKADRKDEALRRGNLNVVKPETLIRWHRKGFHLIWRRKSRPTGRPRPPKDIQVLIRQMATENPPWG